MQDQASITILAHRRRERELLADFAFLCRRFKTTWVHVVPFTPHLTKVCGGRSTHLLLAPKGRVVSTFITVDASLTREQQHAEMHRQFAALAARMATGNAGHHAR